MAIEESKRVLRNTKADQSWQKLCLLIPDSVTRYRLLMHIAKMEAEITALKLDDLANFYERCVEYWIQQTSK